MIIGIDAGCLSVYDKRLQVGVYRMTFSLLESLSKIDHKNTYKLFSFTPIDKKLMKFFSGNFENKVIKPTIGWNRIWLPLALRKEKIDIFLGLSQSLPLLPTNTKGIVFVHDLTFEKNPEWFVNSYHKMSLNTKSAVKRADKIIAVSQSTKKDLLNIYNLNSSKIDVIYEGLETRFLKTNKSLLKRKGISRPYLLFVGTFKPSKNIPHIISAFALFRKNHPGYQLVLAGSNFWPDKQIRKTISKLKLEKSVVKLGFVSDDFLGTLYRNASLFVSPSYNEGFGLTFLEAASFGLPIIASQKGSVKELLGDDGALYVNPDDPKQISRALSILCIDKKVRSRLISKAGIKIKNFSWKKTARKLIGLYKSL